MAEGLAIAGFAIGALGFILTARNAITQLQEDVHVFGNHHEMLVDVCDRLGTIQGRIETWKRIWRVSDGASKELFLDYWGSEAYAKILRRLAILEQHAQQIMPILAKLLRPHGKGRALPGWPRMYHSPSSSNTDCNAPMSSTDVKYYGAEEVQHLKGQLEGLKQRLGWFPRLRGVLWDHPELKRCMIGLQSSMAELELGSRYAFMNMHEVSEQADWGIDMDMIAARRFLTSLEACTRVHSDELRNLCLEQSELLVHYRLDHCSLPEDRLLKMQRYDVERRMPYYLRLSTSGPQALVSNVRLEPVVSEAKQTTELGSGEGSSSGRVIETSDRRMDSARATSFDFGRRFVVEPMNGPKQDAMNLRTFMQATQTDFTDTLHGAFTKPERTQLAYELAECAFLVLRTGWMSRLCSCIVSRIGGPLDDPYFALQIGSAAHTEHGAASDVVSSPWCQMELDGMHIRRLGLLLIEIGIGVPIEEAWLEEDDTVPDVFLSSDSRQRNDLPTHSRLAYILRRVRYEAGSDFHDAVQYCLRQSSTPTDISNASGGRKVVLDEFYQNVVARLFIHYQKEVVEPAKRRKIRRAQREQSKARTGSQG